MTAHTEARPRRQIPRYPLTQEVLLHTPGNAPRSYLARDVSQGGFFLATEDPFELFSDVELVVTLPGGRRATLSARIVHILPPEKAQRHGVPAGIGVQFEGLNEQQQGYVRELVAWARDNDPRPRIARRLPSADLSALDGEPMLTYVLEHIDGKRDPEALADELGIEPGSVERMLRELVKRDIIELVSAGGPAPQHAGRAPQGAMAGLTAPKPTAAASDDAAPRQRPSALDPKQAAHMAALEERLARANFYILLNVPDSASSDAIREAFHSQSARLQLSGAPASEVPRIERLQNHLREAYGVLSSPQKRKEYDQYLDRGRKLAEAEAQRAGRASLADASLGRVSRPRNLAAASRSSERRVAVAPRSRLAAAEQAQPLGAAAQILTEAEQAIQLGKMEEASKHLQLLTAMTFEDARIRANVAKLKTVVSRALAVDFEKQAAYEEKQQRWGLAARSWLRVAEGRPKDSLPLQRAALAQLQAGVELRQVMETAKRAVELAPNDPQTHRTLARVYVAAGMQANARRALETAQRCGDEPATPAQTPKPAKPGGLFKRLLGREAPN